MKNLLIFGGLLAFLPTTAQQVVHLYSGELPNSRPTPNKEYTDSSGRVPRTFFVTEPTLTLFPAQNSGSGVAVIVIPGGGYKALAADHEGWQVARALNEKEITAAVLKYRLPSRETMIDPATGPIQDAQRAIQYLREHAAALKINPDKIGLMGFSAGGHLAALAGTRYQKAHIANRKRTRLRPDFVCLVYPVISMSDSLAHQGSRESLLGVNPSEKMIRDYSPDSHINSKTPPFFLVHAQDDDVVKAQHSELLYQRLREEDIAAGYYQYQRGGHGFGLINPHSQTRWLDLFTSWLKEIGVLKEN